jgi:peptidoglycan/LPS O-acetylase OafA/YrhL
VRFSKAAPSPSRFSRASRWGIALLLVASAVVLTQDLTGSLFGKWCTCKVTAASANLPEMVKPRYPTSLPEEEHLRRQLRLTQDGRALRGPFRFMAETQASPGRFMLGEKTFWVQPHADHPKSPQEAHYELWIPQPIPHWLRWPVYCGIAFLLWGKMRRYYQAHPLNEGKLAYLEALRGIACLVVVVTHFVGVFYQELNDPVVQGKAWYDIVSLHRYVPFASLLNAGAFAVDTFFVLSGFVLFLPFAGSGPVDMTRARESFLRRPVRLFGVLAAVMTLVWLLRQSGLYFENSHVAPKFTGEFLGDLGMAYTTSVQYSPVFWTINIELWGSFIIYLLAMLVGGSWARWLSYPVLAWVLREGPYANFIFGALLADMFKSLHLPRTWQWLRSAAPALFILGLLVGLQTDHDTLEQGFDHWVGGLLPNFKMLLPNRGAGLAGAILLVSALLLSPWLQRLFTRRSLNCLGRQSYAIYGIHEVIIFTVMCWVFLMLVPISPATVWDIWPTGGYYHLGVLVTLLLYLTLVWLASVTLTAFVDEPCIRLAQKLARLITGSRQNKEAATQPSDPRIIITGAVASPEG